MSTAQFPPTTGHGSSSPNVAPLYTADERRRRDASVWTVVQGVLAPLQFVVFLCSAALIARYVLFGVGFDAATISVIVKTVVLYVIMITGAIWEHEVFGCYLFARAFFWEDVMSFVVLALHTAYLLAVMNGWMSSGGQIVLALSAYAAYLVNAIQFVLKLRAARRSEVFPASDAGCPIQGVLT
jgi:3-vinyl bacteriochlorophyllide hydratase